MGTVATFGAYIRNRRESLRESDPSYTVRGVARKIGVAPCYISRIERDDLAPPSAAAIRSLADALGEDPDTLLALGGKVSADLKQVIMKRPKLFAQLIRELKDLPDHAVLRVVREVRDGKW